MKKNIEMSKNNDCTTGDLFDYIFKTLQTNCNRFKQIN